MFLKITNLVSFKNGVGRFFKLSLLRLYFAAIFSSNKRNSGKVGWESLSPKKLLNNWVDTLRPKEQNKIGNKSLYVNEITNQSTYKVFVNGSTSLPDKNFSESKPFIFIGFNES